MYIDKDNYGYFQLMEMSIDELKALARMIEGASLEERRIFHSIYKMIK